MFSAKKGVFNVTLFWVQSSIMAMYFKKEEKKPPRYEVICHKIASVCVTISPSSWNENTVRGLLPRP